MRFGRSRKENQRFHAKKRFKERFDIEFNKKIRRKVCKQIANNEFKLMEKQSERYWAYYGKILDYQVIIIYDRFKKNIVTCLYYELYLKKLYRKLGKGIVGRIKREVEQMAGIEFTDEQNKQIQIVIHRELKKIRKLVKSEINIANS